MSHVTTPWTVLASNVAKAILARKGVTVEEAAERFNQRHGTSESTRSIDGKIYRGTFSFAFFLQLLVALRVEVPEQWDAGLQNSEDYTLLARHVFLRELARHNLDVERFVSAAERDFGGRRSTDDLIEQIEQGSFQFVVVLELASIAWPEGMERFVDRSDVVSAAIAQAKILKQAK